MGIFSALKTAAYYNSRDALEAIFQGKPGLEIDREILENIRDLFQSFSLEATPVHHEYKFLLGHPDRQGIVDLFNREIAHRY